MNQEAKQSNIWPGGIQCTWQVAAQMFVKKKKDMHWIKSSHVADSPCILGPEHVAPAAEVASEVQFAPVTLQPRS
jgi:hypothetical protein